MAFDTLIMFQAIVAACTFVLEVGMSKGYIPEMPTYPDGAFLPSFANQ
jgi:hypothetical protein